MLAKMLLKKAKLEEVMKLVEQMTTRKPGY